MPTPVDIEAAFRVWGNTRTTTLVGTGHPLALGFFEQRLRSPGRGVYCVVETTDAGDGQAAEGGIWWARLSMEFWSATDRLAAREAALATMAELPQINATRPTAGGTALLMTSEITGPTWQPGEDEPRYTVTAVVHATSAP